MYALISSMHFSTSGFYLIIYFYLSGLSIDLLVHILLTYVNRVKLAVKNHGLANSISVRLGLLEQHLRKGELTFLKQTKQI